MSKIIFEGYNNQDYYIVVTEYEEQKKPHTMFYKSKESYEEYKRVCKEMDDMFWQQFLYGESSIRINNV